MNAITLINDQIKVTLLPIGAKLVSLIFNGKEVLYTKFPHYEKPEAGSVFDTRFAWGGDICFPSVSKTSLSLENTLYSIDDHGNFWNREFKILSQTATSASLEADDGFFKLQFDISLKNNSLERTYHITNISQFDLPYIFADHLLLPINKNHQPFEYISIDGDDRMLIEYSFDDKAGKKGAHFDWKKPRVRPFADKLFGQLRKNSEDNYSFSYKNLDENIAMKFSSKDLPYIGYWHTEGGWNNEYNLGLEFTNGMVDTINSQGENSLLTMGGLVKFHIKILLM